MISKWQSQKEQHFAKFGLNPNGDKCPHCGRPTLSSSFVWRIRKDTPVCFSCHRSEKELIDFWRQE